MQSIDGRRYHLNVSTPRSGTSLLSLSSAPERPAGRRLSLLHRHLGLGPVEDLEKLGDAVAHARVHVGLGALDGVVQVVAEQLDRVDARVCQVGVGKVPGGQDCRSAAVETW